jgi:phosphoglucosamine mutase
MRKNGHIICGEQSGHIIFSKYANPGDGLLTAIKIMQVMIESKLPLSKLAAPVSVYPQVLKNVIVDDKDATMQDEAVKNAVALAERDLGDRGRVPAPQEWYEPVLSCEWTWRRRLRGCEQRVDGIIEAMALRVIW